MLTNNSNYKRRELNKYKLADVPVSNEFKHNQKSDIPFHE